MNSKQALNQFFNCVNDICNQEGTAVYFVGGCVRDALLGIASTDYDLAIEPQGFERLFQALQKHYHIKKSLFSTFSLIIGEYNIDVAAFRNEKYDHSNGLPTVELATIDEDIHRRDFTINTGYVLIDVDSIHMMLSEQGNDQFEIDYCHAEFWSDLRSHTLRILHADSFVQDASRMLRAVKYQVKLKMTFEDETKKYFNSVEARNALNCYSLDRYKQIILDYVSNENGCNLLNALYKEKLLIGIENDPHQEVAIHFNEIFFDLSESMVTEITEKEYALLLLLYIYRDNLVFWKNQSRTLNVLIDEIVTILNEFNEMKTYGSWHCYQVLNGKSLSSVLFAKLVIDKEAARDAFLIYLNCTRSIKLSITGNDLKDLGVTEGKQFNKLLEALLEYKVSQLRLMNTDEEIKWIASKMNEY
ncbi:tRNA nucleotidyltransferase/poly(A) polymerase family protein [Fusibacter bizertensis]